MAIIELTDDNIDTLIAQHNFLCIDFWSESCGPCKSFEPVFEAVATTHPAITFARCNLTAYPSIAEDFMIRSVPHLMILRERVAVFDESGALDKATLEDLLMQAAALNLDDLRAQLAALED
jgi:thioredoxin 1